MGKSNAFEKYHVMQVVLKEKVVGVGSKNLAEVEKICNQQYDIGYELYTFSQLNSKSFGFFGGDRIIVNLIFKKIA